MVICTMSSCDTSVVAAVLKHGLAAARCVRLSLCSIPKQFPCVIKPDGNIHAQPVYTAGLKKKAAVLTALTRYTTDDLPPLAGTLRRAGITIDGTVGGSSSHGVVFYVTIAITDAAKEFVMKNTPCLQKDFLATKDSVRAVMKLMALPKPKNRREHMTVKTHDSSLLDPYLTCLGSGMVADGSSVGFAHLYGTFLATTTLRDVPDTPVVVMLTERLDDSLDGRIAACMKEEHVQWRRLVGLILQAMTILAQGQALCGLVHNDAHLGNFMVSSTLNVDSKPPSSSTSTHAYVQTPNGGVLRLPLRERVALIDFGRSSFSTTDIGGERLVTSELLEKFPKWKMNDVHADVMHFAAMLILIQPRPDFFERQAEQVETGGAPPCARALLRLIRAALQCDSVDMFAQYGSCRATAKKGCANSAIHTLRSTKGGCAGALPTDWLMDAELVDGFLHKDGAMHRHVLHAGGSV